MHIAKVNEEFKKLIGSRFLTVFYQPTAGTFCEDNLMVINFKKQSTLFSLHAFCFVRFVDEDKVLLTSSDEFFDDNYKKFSELSKKNLLKTNIEKIILKQKGIKVSNVSVNSTGDIIIEFENEVKLEIIIDCLYDKYEYYRLLLGINDGDKQLVATFDKNNGIKFEIK